MQANAISAIVVQFGVAYGTIELSPLSVCIWSQCPEQLSCSVWIIQEMRSRSNSSLQQMLADFAHESHL
eukprot:2528754-Amphidinium_carterae.1